MTDLLDWICSGTLKGYLFRPGQIPKVQPNDLWQDTKLLHGLLAGYVYEGNPNQQHKAYIIVREDELAGTLKAHQPGGPTEIAENPDKAAGSPQPSGQPRMASHSSKAVSRNKLKSWLETRTKKEPVLTKKRCLEATRLEFGTTAISMNMLNEAWRDAKLPKTWRKPGRRPGT